MKSLFQLMWRNNFTIVFVLLWSFCFYLVISNNRFQQVSVFNSANRAVSSVMEVVHYFSEYINLKETNESLAKENARLRSMLTSNNYSLNVVDTTIKDTTYLQQYSYIEARVVNNSVNRRNNYLTLDKGSLQGITTDMGVISSDGVVGIVKDVAPHYCTVMSVLHKNSKVSARLLHTDYFGSLVWNGGDSRTASLLDIAKHVKMHKGDTLVTTVYSAVFPEGISVGTIQKFELSSDANFFDIDVTLANDFARLSHVYIVRNLLKNEQQGLEQKSESNDDN